ncbi:hypothetical protein MKW98_015419 [Papaver atlanticum]|uniref:Uncharacterized protein n=1 Tax=Papaver atlanticum TaxID=357466 RepID=A0AAD4X5Z5_9MAGN|nr:hypothetical protein MKW98_015419 [Papaver atlanticum]
MDSRSSLRQGALAQRRSSFQGNSHFPLANEVANKAGTASARNNRPFNRSRQGNCNTQRFAPSNLLVLVKIVEQTWKILQFSQEASLSQKIRV